MLRRYRSATILLLVESILLAAPHLCPRTAYRGPRPVAFPYSSALGSGLNPKLERLSNVRAMPHMLWDIADSAESALAPVPEAELGFGLNPVYRLTSPSQRGMGIAGDIFISTNVQLPPHAMTRVLTYAQPVAVPEVTNGREGASWCFSLGADLLVQMPTTIRNSFTLAVILNVIDQNHIYGPHGSTVETDFTVSPVDANAYRQLSTGFDNDNLPARDPLTITISVWNSSSADIPVVRWSGASREAGRASRLRIAMWNN